MYVQYSYTVVQACEYKYRIGSRTVFEQDSY